MSDERDDRQHRELTALLEELRVALPGVQVLFAFLLTIPFTQRFADATDLQKRVYFGAVLTAAAATILLIAPTALHRIVWRQDDRERTLVTSSRLAVSGTLFLAITMTAVIFLITDLLFDAVVVIALVTGTAALVFAWFWYVLPLTRRIRRN